MTGLALLITDTALREAVLEQMAAQKLSKPDICTKASIGSSLSSVLVIDEEDADDKVFATLAAKDTKPVLLLLGQRELGEVSESFSKPLRLGHFLARVRYYLETAPLLSGQSVVFGGFRLEAPRRRLIVVADEREIMLTEKEAALLLFLAKRKTPANRSDILAHVWGYDERIDTHTLETHIYQLRRKLETGGMNCLLYENGTYYLVHGGQ